MGHARTWSDMPEPQKRKFEGVAESLAEARRRELDGDIDLARSAIRLHAERTRDEMEKEGRPLRVSACALDTQAVLAFDTLAKSPEFTASRANALRPPACKPPSHFRQNCRLVWRRSALAVGRASSSSDQHG